MLRRIILAYFGMRDPEKLRKKSPFPTGNGGKELVLGG
jgi:hypothetical protein